MVLLDLTLTTTDWVVSGKLLEELFINKLFGCFEIKSVGATFTDLLPSVTKEIEQRLQHTMVLNDRKSAEVQEVLLPLFRAERVVLDGRYDGLTGFFTALRSADASLSGRAQLITVDLLLVDNHAFRIVETLGDLLKANFLELHKLLLFRHSLSALSLSGTSLSSLLELGLILNLVLLLVVLKVFTSGNLCVNIILKIIFLALLPAVSVTLHGAKCEQSFVIAEFAVLTHSVEAADKLNLLGLVGRVINLFPHFLLRLESLTVGLHLLFKLRLCMLEVCFFFSLFLSLVVDMNLVCDTSVKGFLEHTCFVLEADRHVGSKLWHLEEVNSTFSHDFRNDLELWKDLLWFLHRDWDWVTLFVKLRLNSCWFILSSHLGKKIVGDTGSRLKNFINQKFVFGVSVTEVDVGCGFSVDMSLVVILIGDGFLGLNHLADINGRCFSADFQVIVQILKLITEVARLVDQRVESFHLVSPLLGFIVDGFLDLFVLSDFFVVLELTGADSGVNLLL